MLHEWLATFRYYIRSRQAQTHAHACELQDAGNLDEKSKLLGTKSTVILRFVVCVCVCALRTELYYLYTIC